MSILTFPWELSLEHEGTQTFITQLSPKIIVGGFEIDVNGYGNCESMKFRINPELLRAHEATWDTLPARAVVTYEEDGEVLFWGVVVTTPSPDSEGAGPEDDDAEGLEGVECVGMLHLLDESVCDNRFFNPGCTLASAIEYWLENHPNPIISDHFASGANLDLDLSDSSGDLEFEQMLYLPQMTTREAIELMLSKHGEFAFGINAAKQFFVRDIS